ncbi:sigma-70 family RNA polymerase sigma factor [Xanthomonas euvesicatoria pv. eucalypti]|uniref:RNA polymerase sigma factor n=1 Tax=Xanthomonas euvesicatoria TaxID=456327 RepID=UPI0026E33E61|nr:sigma-70 family RNA polymerase sigma factor [Xanthomonas euvesicatoria]MDO7943790.1 sigma-70 family RNA polymerase sigma factor [Xanthomonas euvesicatoria pv. eucalypti]
MDALDDDQLRAVLPALRRFARSLSGEPASADDLVQATLERALRRWHTRHTAEALQPWLFAILYRQFLDGQRRAARWQRVVGRFAPPQPRQSASAEQVHDGRAMLASLASLPAEQRALLLLVSVDGFSYREVADTLGIPIGTVMSRLSRARERLRAVNEGQVNHAPALRILK